ncbi:MAG TPA: DNA repair protein RecO [Candidatus Merdenecus merdavium]|nr:DNA repair protein RecO [Candidatus Merdenecus merdavium]
MREAVNLTGMILSVMPIGDFDKRLVILTKERGKIVAFAKGARRQNSALLAATNPFVFGELKLYEGRNSYNLLQAHVTNYFIDLRVDYEAACYGMYFLEFAEYYTQENNDEAEMLKLLYASLKALNNPYLDHNLVRYIFELKALVINGEYPDFFSCISCGKEERLGFFSVQGVGTVCEECYSSVSDARKIGTSTLYTLQYIVSSPTSKLYTFTVSEEVLRELKEIIQQYMKRFVQKGFKSLKVLNEMNSI